MAEELLNEPLVSLADVWWAIGGKHDGKREYRAEAQVIRTLNRSGLQAVLTGPRGRGKPRPGTKGPRKLMPVAEMLRLYIVFALIEKRGMRTVDAGQVARAIPDPIDLAIRGQQPVFYRHGDGWRYGGTPTPVALQMDLALIFRQMIKQLKRGAEVQEDPKLLADLERCSRAFEEDVRFHAMPREAQSEDAFAHTSRGQLEGAVSNPDAEPDFRRACAAELERRDKAWEAVGKALTSPDVRAQLESFRAALARANDATLQELAAEDPDPDLRAAATAELKRRAAARGPFAYDNRKARRAQRSAIRR